MTPARTLATRNGTLRFPAYIPVTTFGNKYPLDNLLRPYLPRLAQAVMVSYYYARQMQAAERPRLPVMVDSGGFAALFANAQVDVAGGCGIIRLTADDGVSTLHPKDILDYQEQIADVAFTLDFPIPPGTETLEAHRRMDLTIANAFWALENRRRRDLPLYSVVQAWDADSASACARAYARAGFAGVAIGGLVPRARDRGLVLSMVEAVRREIGDLPLHVLGLGKPEIVDALFKAGVDSVDSSSYVKLAADGRLWSKPDLRIPDPTPIDRLHLALCNLASAAGRTLPLSMTRTVFLTRSLDFQLQRAQ
jgi:helicase